MQWEGALLNPSCLFLFWILTTTSNSSMNHRDYGTLGVRPFGPKKRSISSRFFCLALSDKMAAFRNCAWVAAMAAVGRSRSRRRFGVHAWRCVAARSMTRFHHNDGAFGWFTRLRSETIIILKRSWTQGQPKSSIDNFTCSAGCPWKLRSGTTKTWSGVGLRANRHAASLSSLEAPVVLRNLGISLQSARDRFDDF